MKLMKETNQDNMKSLTKALEILKLFLDRETELSLSEIAEQLNLNKTTVHRIMAKLIKYNYLNQKENRGKYILGTVYFDFSRLIRSRQHLRNVAYPHLMKLSRNTNESVALALEQPKGRLYSEVFYNGEPAVTRLNVTMDENVSMPMNSNSVGKIILANMSSKEFKQYFDNANFRKYTPNSITDFDDLSKHLAKVKQEGIAYDREECAIGVTGVAIKLEMNGKFYGAVGIVAPTIRMDNSKIKQSISKLKSCVDDIFSEYNSQY